MTAVDVLVVGGGPSGLAAAWSAARGGASVLLVDEWPEPGGRLRYRRAGVPLGGSSLPAAALRASLVERATAAGVEVRTGTVAWGAFRGSRGVEVGLQGMGGGDVVTPARLILATGTTDRAAVVPGGTSPGVMTARALQLLLHVHGVRPGRCFMLLGDDRADELRGDIEAAGGVVVRTVPASEVPAVAIEGQGGVHRLTVGEEAHAVDVVVTALGTMPDDQLARMLGCELASSGAWPPVPRRADDGSLSIPGVALCGSVAGAASIEAAILDGARVGRGEAGVSEDVRADLLGAGAGR